LGSHHDFWEWKCERQNGAVIPQRAETVFVLILKATCYAMPKQPAEKEGVKAEILTSEFIM